MSPAYFRKRSWDEQWRCLASLMLNACVQAELKRRERRAEKRKEKEMTHVDKGG